MRANHLQRCYHPEFNFDIRLVMRMMVNKKTQVNIFIYNLSVHLSISQTQRITPSRLAYPVGSCKSLLLIYGRMKWATVTEGNK